VLNGGDYVIVESDHNPDAASAVDFARPETRLDQSLTGFTGNPKGASLTWEFPRSIRVVQDKIESLRRNSAPLGLTLCMG
jgi:hypothetical protein